MLEPVEGAFIGLPHCPAMEQSLETMEQARDPGGELGHGWQWSRERARLAVESVMGTGGSGGGLEDAGG